MNWMEVNQKYEFNMRAVMLNFFPRVAGVGGYSRPTEKRLAYQRQYYKSPCRNSLFEFCIRLNLENALTTN